MIGERLRKARKIAGYNQEKLARELGYKGRQTVANWENGYCNPPLKVALKIATILNVDLKEILLNELEG